MPFLAILAFLLILILLYFVAYRQYIKKYLVYRGNRKILLALGTNPVTVIVHKDEYNLPEYKGYINTVDKEKIEIITDIPLDADCVDKTIDVSFFLRDGDKPTYHLFSNYIISLHSTNSGTSFWTHIPRVIACFEQRLFPRVRIPNEQILALGFWIYPSHELFPSDVSSFGPIFCKNSNSEHPVSVLNVSGSGIGLSVSTAKKDAFTTGVKIILLLSFVSDAIHKLLLSGIIVNVRNDGAGSISLGIEFVGWQEAQQGMQTITWNTTKRWLGVPPILDWIAYNSARQLS